MRSTRVHGYKCSTEVKRSTSSTGIHGYSNGKGV